MLKTDRISISFYILIIVLFICIVAPNLFSKGMFMDGLIYATVARNMAEGAGSFWYPHFSETLFNQFHEHPAFAIGLQSLWFRIFGDSIYVERFYSLSVFFLAGFLIVAIWKEITGESKTAWQALLLWIVLPLITWACSNNMLENTLSLFICLSVLLYLKSFKKFRFLFLILSGLSLSLALLSKGFVALFPWCFPFLFWLFMHKRKFLQMVLDSIIVVAATLLPIILLYFFSESAADSMSKYINIQVITSLENIRTVDTRFYILGKFFIEIIPALVLGAVVVFISYMKKIDLTIIKTKTRGFLLFMVFSLSGVIPIMISMKQRRFYILAVYPFFAIALAYLLSPLMKKLLKGFSERSRKFKLFQSLSYLALLISIIISFTQINRVGRDKKSLHDAHLIIESIGTNQIINMCQDIRTDWSFQAYLARHGKISLEYKDEIKYPYLVVRDSFPGALMETEFIKTDLPTRRYHLYKRLVPQIEIPTSE